MSGLSSTEIFIMVALLAPLSLLVTGFILLYAYAIYLVISERVFRFLNNMNLKHRKSQ